jgi:hypothetical protein
MLKHIKYLVFVQKKEKKKEKKREFGDKLGIKVKIGDVFIVILGEHLI